MAPATVNRYTAALAAVITWSIKKRIAPKHYVHPCRNARAGLGGPSTPSTWRQHARARCHLLLKAWGSACKAWLAATRTRRKRRRGRSAHHTEANG